MNEYFQPASVPAPSSPGSSAIMRQEFASIAAGFDKLPVMSGNANELVLVNPTGTGLTTTGKVITDYVTDDGVFTLTNKTIAWASNTFPGFGTAATKNAGTAAGNVPILSGASKLPALDGSLLTNLNVNQAGTVVDIPHGGTGATTVPGAQVALGIDLKADNEDAVLTGTPTAPTAPLGTSTTQIATTEFVAEGLALKADADDAVLTGAPTAPTPPTGDNSARIATTYFVVNTVQDIGAFAPSNASPLMDGVASSGVGVLGSRDDHRHPTDTTRAPLASPALTGNPTAPTPAVGDNDTSIATTAFVSAEIANDRPYSTTNPLINGTAAQGSSANVSRQDHVHPTDTTRAPLASPTFTGDPKAPTPATSDNDTSIATTAFVQSLLAQQPPAGMQPSNNVPLMDGVAAAGTGVSGARDDHRHPSDTSRLALTGGALTGRLTVSVNTATDALRVTQTGSGNVAVFEDSANPDSSPVVIDGDGRVSVGTTSPQGRLHVHPANNSEFGIVIGRGDVSTERFSRLGFTHIDAAEEPVIGLNFYADATRNLLTIGGETSVGNTCTEIRFNTAANNTTLVGTEAMRIDSTGSVGIGAISLSDRTLGISRNITGAATAFGVLQGGAVQPDVTSGAFGFSNHLVIAASAFTLTDYKHFRATQVTIGAGSSIVNQSGFHVENTLTGATNNYGFYSNLAAATGRWNFYAAGTAASFFGGDLNVVGVPTTSQVPNGFSVTATLTIAALRSGIITSTPAAAINLTLPTGTLTDAAFNALQTNQSFEWSIINLAAATHAVTVLAGTAHTVVGNMVVAANTSGRFLTRKTATNTFVTYRIA